MLFPEVATAVCQDAGDIKPDPEWKESENSLYVLHLWGDTVPDALKFYPLAVIMHLTVI